MKRIITLLAFTTLTLYSFSQITITSADMPSVNDTIRLSETNDIQGLDPVLTGANYSWNFSALVPNVQRVDTFFSVSSTPVAYQFFFNNVILYPNHKASYAMKGRDIGIPQVPITEVFNYIKNSSSAYDNVGFGSKINGIPSSTQNNPVDREYEFPMDYLNNDSSYSTFSVSVPGFGAYGQIMARIDTVDGWGSLTLPNGIYNVLRVKSRILSVDSIYMDAGMITIMNARPDQIEYKWLANGKSLPMLKIITVAGNITRIEYQDDIFVGVEEIKVLNDVTVFPNPTKNHLAITFNTGINGEMVIKLKDVLGKDLGIIYTNNVNAGNNKVLIDLMQYSIKPGIYFLDVLVDEKQYYTKKLIVIE